MAIKKVTLAFALCVCLFLLTACSKISSVSESGNRHSASSTKRGTSTSSSSESSSKQVLQHGEVPTKEDLQSHRWQYKSDGPDDYVFFTEGYTVKFNMDIPKSAWGRMTMVFPYTVADNILTIDYGMDGVDNSWVMSWQGNNIVLTPNTEDQRYLDIRTQILLLAD